MKKLLVLFVTTGLILSTILTACTSPRSEEPEPSATEIPQSALPNPASVFCQENGNTLEIQTAADGSQSGVCVFPDGTTCEEWAYFRGECGSDAQKKPTPAVTVEATRNASGGYIEPGTSEEIADWWGVIKSTKPGAEYEDFFERQYLGGVLYFGIDSLDPQVNSQIEALRDSGKIVHLYGTLLSNVPDYNGSQIQVDRIEFEN